MAEVVTLVDLQIDVDLAVKDSKRLKEEIELLKSQARQAKDEQGELSEEFIQYSAALKTAQKELRVNNKLTEDAIQADLAKEGSVEKLRKQLSVVSVQWAKLSKEERENTEEGKKLSKQKLELTETLKDEEKATGDASRNVGNYGDALEDLDGITGGVIGQVKALGKQFLKLASNPIVLLITAIVGGLALLINSFKKSQEGADTFAKAFDAVNASIDAVLGRLAGLASNIKALITGKQSLEEFKKQASGTFKGITKEIKDTVKESNRLFDLRKGLVEATIAATEYVAELNVVAEEQAAIADNATLSFQEREEAARLAEEALIEARETEFELAEQAFEIIEEENNLKESQGLLTDELRQKEADAKAEALQAQSDLNIARIETSKRRAELAQDNFEQELDFLLDIADASKTVNEKRIADETIAFDERVRILGETRTLIDESFDQQIKLFEAENEINIERDKLLTLNNEQIFEYARGLELSEIETNRLREVIIDRKKAQQDLNESAKDLNDERIANEEAYYAAEKKLADDAYDADIARLNQINQAEIFTINQRIEREKANVFQILDLQKERLEIQKQQEIEAAEAIGADTTQIREFYTRKQLEIDAQKADVGLALASDAIQAISGLFIKNAKIQKAAAIAAATIDTARAVIAAVAATPGGIVIKAAAGVTAGLIGAAQIAAIAATPIDNIESGSSGGTSVGASNPSNIAVPRNTGTKGGENIPDATGTLSLPGTDSDSEIGGGIVNRDIDNERSFGSTTTVLVEDDVTFKQNESRENDRIAVL